MIISLISSSSRQERRGTEYGNYTDSVSFKSISETYLLKPEVPSLFTAQQGSQINSPSSVGIV